MTETKESDKFKVIKVSILRRSLEYEEKHGFGKVTSFSWHEGKTIMKNFAFWNLPSRGIISFDDVKTGIYQLEKLGLVEIIDLTNLCLTKKGMEVAKELRTVKFENIPDNLFVDKITAPPQPSNIRLCPNCQKQIELESVFCEFCGRGLQKGNDFCNYCGAELRDGAKFCANCGKTI
jgi:hypothetical protein